jgi:hypothetical protein
MKFYSANLFQISTFFFFPGPRQHEPPGQRRRHVLPDVPAPGAGRHPARLFLAGLRALPAHPEVRPLSQPRRRVGAQGTQEILSMARLQLRQVHPDRRATEGDGGPSRPPEATSPRGERGQRAGHPLPDARIGRGRRPRRDAPDDAANPRHGHLAADAAQHLHGVGLVGAVQPQ